MKHFCEVVEQIERNSWWAANFAPGKKGPSGFTVNFTQEGTTLSPAVPQEALDSLLLRVRKLTMSEAPENMLKIRKALKAKADQFDRPLLDTWQKYWRLAFIKDPFQVVVDDKYYTMTPYRVYDCFVNNLLFHSNNPKMNVILHGKDNPQNLSDPSGFLKITFYGAVTNLCFAAIGLKRFIDNGSTFKNIPLLSNNHPAVVDFIFHRKVIDQIDEQYKIFNDWVASSGDNDKCNWN
jgi:hypothetical protein